MCRFGVRRKLNPRFIGPFEILKRIGLVAYWVALPPRLAGTHDAFHVSVLRKYVYDPSLVVDFSFLEFEQDLSYQEYPMRIRVHETKELRNRVLPIMKVQWSHHDEGEATWELEEEMRTSFPYLFEASS